MSRTSNDITIIGNKSKDAPFIVTDEKTGRAWTVPGNIYKPEFANDYPAVIAKMSDAAFSSDSVINAITNYNTSAQQSKYLNGQDDTSVGTIYKINDQAQILLDSTSDYVRMAGVNGIADSVPQTITEIKSQASATANKLPGFTMNKTTSTVDGDFIDPYKFTTSPIGLVRQTIGGSDLVCYYIAEFPKMQDIIDDVPVEVQQKELMVIEMDNVMSLSYSTIRERFPVRTLGNINPVAHTASSRTIAGYIAFTVFTEDALAHLRSKLQNQINETMANFSNYAAKSQRALSDMKNKYEQVLEENTLAKKSDIMRKANEYGGVQLLDTLAPFNILIMGTNEAGNFSRMLLKGVSIVDENQYQGTTMPNITNKVSFVALDIVPMAEFKYNSSTPINSISSITESYINGSYSSIASFNSTMTGSDCLSYINKELRNR